MKKIQLATTEKRMLADVHTPVGIYLRLRDRFRDTVLLESADHHAAENSYSFICINAIAGIEIRDQNIIEYKIPGQPPKKTGLKGSGDLKNLLWNFMQQFEPVKADSRHVSFAQGLYGYFSYDAIQLFETIQFKKSIEAGKEMPVARYRLYQYVIALNHFRNEMILLENKIDGLESEIGVIESLINSKDVPVYPFATKGTETSDIDDAEYIEMVKKGIRSCYRGDVFQVVLSRRFRQCFRGDEFNVYRALRNINPSPYLFFFDYGDYKLFGSSPESQLIITKGRAIVHPIAGTFKRTGDDL